MNNYFIKGITRSCLEAAISLINIFKKLLFAVFLNFCVIRGCECILVYELVIPKAHRAQSKDDSNDIRNCKI